MTIEISKLTCDQLRKICKQYGIKNYSKMLKEDLVKSVKKALKQSGGVFNENYGTEMVPMGRKYIKVMSDHEDEYLFFKIGNDLVVFTSSVPYGYKPARNSTYKLRGDDTTWYLFPSPKRITNGTYHVFLNRNKFKSLRDEISDLESINLDEANDFISTRRK